VRFPAGDSSVDVVFAASLFTHLLEPDSRHYLREVRRVLAPRGRALLSIHTAVPPGVKYQGTETRIDVEKDYFQEMAADAGLLPVDFVEDLAGQQVFVFMPA
jgi:SAM-dependent methyltransferase